jgi:hypothetical protein
VTLVLLVPQEKEKLVLLVKPVTEVKLEELEKPDLLDVELLV